jgi:hypothetical protein
MAGLWGLHDASTVLTVMAVAGTLQIAFSFNPPAISEVCECIHRSIV